MAKPVPAHPLADPDVAARRIVELASGLEPMDSRLLVERVNGPFSFELRGTPAEYKAGLERAIEKGWLVIHESGTYLRFTQAGRVCSPEAIIDRNNEEAAN